MKLIRLTLILCCISLAAAQTPKPPARKAASPAASHVTASKSVAPKTTSDIPTEAEVNEFLRHMFGYDPNLTWKVQAIFPAEAPGVSHVVATIGDQQRPVHLYVLPGGRFAAVGDIIPFGAEPFKPVRDTLQAKGQGTQRGPADAVVTIVEFSDLQCPFCRQAQPIVDRVVNEVPGVRLVFQPFPLPMHPWAMKAASFGECVARQKPAAFWDYVTAVYGDQANITEANVDEKLRGIAATAGVDAAKVSSCAAGPDISLRIQESMELGKAVGVNSTPTVFIQGRKVQSIVDLPYEQLKAMVEFEVGEARRK
jgi:protein-disulfide isomerase